MVQAQQKPALSKNQIRPEVRGNFIFVGEEKFYVRGVTYGTFRPNEKQELFPSRKMVEQDFAAMEEKGINSVRTYTVPPRWLLDVAQQNELKVMIGIPWEQHITFLDDKKLSKDIIARVSGAVKICSGHPAVLCFSLGNEIPSSIVRWHGAKKIEKFIHQLYKEGKKADPEALFTYVNFPTTEYLQLPFLDIVSFNVYLESQDKLQAYLLRLQNLANERPLLMAEIGLDSQRNGEEKQAQVLSWQIETTFAAGCVGTFIFAWTDEWYRGGADIEDWDFGLTTRDRKPKSALAAVSAAFLQTPFADNIAWPEVSVVVCSYNGSSTIRDTMEGLKNLLYPNFEVIVVNDGSTDSTPDIVSEYDVQLISTENRGLSNARNTGYQAASGEIVAYIDDDAYPDPHWLHYLAMTYMTTDFVAVGGPNIAPAGDGKIADCVANAPGGPVQVLLTDSIAEHIPGCNMSFRKTSLEKIGGFDPRYRAAGDDVDACWRVQDQVGEIGFHPTALVWHHRRDSWPMYWKQQQGYGKAEALLEQKWPEKYNNLGHTSWGGRLYGKGWTVNLSTLGGRIYQGTWGHAPFQSLYQGAPTTLLSLPLMPEWYFVIAFLALLTLLGIAWTPLLLVSLPLLLISIILPMTQAAISASRAKFTSKPENFWQQSKLFFITACMHLQQPYARLIGRIKHGLTPWRNKTRPEEKFKLKLLPESFSIWHEEWEDPNETLRKLQDKLRQQGEIVLAGGDYDNWDLEIKSGLWGKVRLKMATEEHGQGKQLNKFLLSPGFNGPCFILIALLLVVSLLAGLNGAMVLSVVLSLFSFLIFIQNILNTSRAVVITSMTVKQDE
jgi:GT2 family glycosyltransferase